MYCGTGFSVPGMRLGQWVCMCMARGVAGRVASTASFFVLSFWLEAERGPGGRGVWLERYVRRWGVCTHGLESRIWNRCTSRGERFEKMSSHLMWGAILSWFACAMDSMIDSFTSSIYLSFLLLRFLGKRLRYPYRFSYPKPLHYIFLFFRLPFASKCIPGNYLTDWWQHFRHGRSG